jgi:diguanylate cyclase (GGDEF)-like protein
VFRANRDRGWRIAAWSAVPLSILLALTVSRSRILTTTGDAIQCLLLLSLVSAIARNVWGARQPRVRIFWLLNALGCGMWLVVQVWWTYFEVILGQAVPNPFAGDIVLFLHLVPIMAALAVCPGIERDRQVARLGSLDFGLLFCWWLYLYLFVVIPWQYVTPNPLVYGRNFDAVYLLEHLVVVLATARALRHSGVAWRGIFRQLFWASSLYAVASVAASIAIDYGNYYTGSLYDIPLIASEVLFITMALSATGTEQPEAGREYDQRSGEQVTFLAIVAASTLPILAGWSVFYSSAPERTRSFRLVLTLVTIVFIGGIRSRKQYTLHRELAHANGELREVSLTDALTGVRNRRFLGTMIEKDVRQSVRFYSESNNAGSNRNRDLIFYLIDLDHFKHINDVYGHAQGDEVLIQIASRISSSIRHSDVLIRWGGEEFMVVSRFTDRAEAEILANRVLEAVGGEPFLLKSERKVFRTCSIGWAVFPWFPADPERIKHLEVIRMADLALYEAKRSGRNQAIGLLSEDESQPGNSLGPPPRHFDFQFPVQTILSMGPTRPQDNEPSLPRSEAAPTAGG